MNATPFISPLTWLHPDPNRREIPFWLESTITWLQQAFRFTAWIFLSLATALASYLLGMAAVIFVFLWHLRIEAAWWPAALCLFLGYLAARGSLSCFDQALGAPPAEQTPAMFPNRERAGGLPKAIGGDCE